MEQWKHTAVLVLSAAIGIGTLTGCQGSSDAVQTGTSKAEETQIVSAGSVEFWNDKYVDTDPEDVNKIFESIEKVSKIQVEPITYPDTAAYQTAIQQSIRDSSAPALFTWWSGPQLETLAKNGLLEDLTDLWEEYVEANGVASDIAEALSMDGKIYAVPYSIIYSTIIYNKEVFAQYQLEIPETFDDFLAVCQTLKDNGVTPIALQNNSWAGFIWFQAMLSAYDPQLYLDVCDGTRKYTDEEVVTVMNQWKEMLDLGYFSAPMSVPDMDKSMAAGTIAMQIGPNYETGILAKEYGMTPGEDMGTFVLPSMNGHKKAVFFEITPLCVAKASQDKETGKEVLKSWFKKEHQTVLTEATSNVNTSEVQTDNACVNEMISYSTDEENYQMMLRYYENTPEEVRNVALDELMKFELGNASAEEVLSTIQAKADEIFQ